MLIDQCKTLKNYFDQSLNQLEYLQLFFLYLFPIKLQICNNYNKWREM